jgi:hypothetical protein
MLFIYGAIVWGTRECDCDLAKSITNNNRRTRKWFSETNHEQQ